MNPEILEKNLKAIEEMAERACLPDGFLENVRNPDWKEEDDLNLEYFRSRQGNGVLRIIHEDGKSTLNHPFEPYKAPMEALTSIKVDDEDTVYFIGMGLGYGVRALARSFKNRDYRLAIFEPSVNSFRLAIQNEDISDLLVSKKIWLGVNPDIRTSFFIMDKAYEPTMTCNLHHLTESYTTLPILKERVENILRGIRDALMLSRINFNTAESSAEILHHNLLKNLGKGLHSATNLSLETGAFKGKPAIVIAPGPSLKKNVHLLKDLYDKAVLIAVDTAYKPLVKAGVKPHIVATIDPNPINAKKFPDEGLPDDIYFYGCLEACYEVWEKAPKYRFAYCRDSSHPSTLMHYIGPKSWSPSGGSVVTDALILGYKMGCDPVVVVGLDLAFTNDQWYAEGSFRTDESERHATDIQVEAIGGGTVGTPVVYYSTLIWLDGNFKNVADATTLIDATEGGAKKKLFINKTLQEVIDEYIKEPFNPHQKLMDCFLDDRKHMKENPPEKELPQILDTLAVIREMFEESFHLYEEMAEDLENDNRDDLLRKADEATHVFQKLEGIIRDTGLLNTLLYSLLVKLASIDTTGLEVGSKEQHRMFLESSREFWKGCLGVIDREVIFIKDEVLEPFAEARAKFLAGESI